VVRARLQLNREGQTETIHLAPGGHTVSENESFRPTNERS
jgi:hypothetical protein